MSEAIEAMEAAAGEHVAVPERRFSDGHGSDAAGPVRLDDLPWATWMEGVEVKILRASTTTNDYTMLSRFAPGVELPRHRHLGAVEAYTFEGRWRYREYDWIAEAGSYVHEEALGTHTFKVLDDNDGPTVCLFQIHGGLVLVGDDDLPWWFEDAETTLTLYRVALEQADQPFPEDLILR